MNGQARISPVYRMGQPSQDPDPLATYARIEHLRRRAWQKCKVVTITPGELPEHLRQQIEAWAEERYGSR